MTAIPRHPNGDRAPSGAARRALVVCDNLEVSEDGRRIYFSEPFDYTGASVDDAVDEAIVLAPNGTPAAPHDLDSEATRLVAEGFHFINGVLYDLHPGQAREDSVLVTQTSLFRLTRFNLRGPKAGSAEVVLDGITGMNDGMDRDAAGRIWLALFTERGSLLTWVHVRLAQAALHAVAGQTAAGPPPAAYRRAGREPRRENATLCGALRRGRAGVCGFGDSVTRRHLSGK